MSLPWQFAHTIFHHHHHDHGGNQHFESSCTDTDPCHLSIFHTSKDSGRACTHEAHYTNSADKCCDCSDFSVSAVKYLGHAYEWHKAYASLQLTEDNYCFNFSANFLKHVFDRGPPAL